MRAPGLPHSMLLGLALAAWMGHAWQAEASPELPPVVSLCVLDGMVDAGSSAYLVDCVRRAEEAGHDALVLQLDTPGGELESTRDVVRAFLGARVPVLVWVGPSGARAGSAGVFITLASHVAAMAPGTNIGAAHPVVGLTGQDPEAAGGQEMARKVLNDTIAFAEAIARQRGRNVEWAVEAVRESASVTAEKALELKVIELLSPTLEGFLEQAHGRPVTLEGEPVPLRTANAQVVELTPTLPQRILHTLAQPGVVYILFLVAALGVAVEISQPGLIIPGLVGVVCLMLALLASAALPVRTGAVLLLVLGMGLLIAEVFVGSGLLGIAGVVVLLLGGVFLVDRFDTGWLVDHSLQPPLRLVVPTTLFAAGGAAWLAWRTAQSRRLPQQSGDEGMVGEMGHALGPVTPAGGEVFVHGERWAAISTQPIPPDARIVVRRVEGLTLFVDEVSS
jgi:membrane-bound serine protease (ClpP class)